MSTQLTIVSGPSKFELMLALFDARHHQVVNFSTQEKNQSRVNHQVGINAVSQEDGSGESWCFEGFLQGKVGQRVKGWFRTNDRHGWLKFV